MNAANPSAADATAARPPWRALVLTLFPELFPGPLAGGLVGAALDKGLWQLEAMDLRDFATDKHRTVDDAPFGGGPGMVLRPDVVARGLDEALAKSADFPVLYPSARGRPLTQARVQELAQGGGVVLLCGRYEGVDQRVLDARSVEEVCVGDFVFAGGELPAMAIVESAVRLLPGTMGNEDSAADESFAADLLEYPQYTRPAEWEGRTVPEPLRSGDHGRIARWRREMAEQTTRERRPDLWDRHSRTRPADQAEPHGTAKGRKPDEPTSGD